MRLLILAFFIFTSLSSYGAKPQKNKKPKPFFTPSDFKVIPLNSPVKEAMAKFKLELPIGMKIDYVKVKLVNTRDLRKDQKKFENVEVTGNSELHVPVSELPPGFYRLYVKVKHKMNKEEIQYKSALLDFVRFAVDSSLEVPAPDMKLNNATLQGVDSDNDGIRDDVQRYILEKYNGKVKPNTLQAIKQFASSYQDKLLYGKDIPTTAYYNGRMAEAMWCIFGIAGSETDYSKEIIQKYLNTKERFQRSLQQRGWYKGNGYPESIIAFQKNQLTDKSYFCGFEP